MNNYVDSTKLQEYTTKLVAKLKTIFPGPAVPAATVAEMTDHTKCYVYTGSETGYTAGNWYYYDGSAWTSGGVYNAVEVETDTTLTESGEPADAAATGTAIAAAKAAVLAEIAPAYSSSATYAVGDYVIYNSGLYRCTTAITTAEAWTAGHWTSVDLAADLRSDVTDLKSAITEIANYKETAIPTAEGAVWLTYPITAGNKYKIIATNGRKATTVRSYTAVDGTQIENFGSIAANTPLIISPTLDAAVLRIYFSSGTAGIVSIDDIGTRLASDEYKIDDLYNITDFIIMQDECEENLLSVSTSVSSTGNIGPVPTNTLTNGDDIYALIKCTNYNIIDGSTNTIIFRQMNAAQTTSATTAEFVHATDDYYFAKLSYDSSLGPMNIRYSVGANTLQLPFVSFGLGGIAFDNNDKKIMYVASNGSDTNDGSAENPLATVNKAIGMGANTILISGGIYEQKIDCSKIQTLRLFAKDKTAKPVFVDPDRLEITDATLSDGVYIADADFPILEVTPKIFQDGFADVTTLISASERMPQQRGKQYRCDDTAIKKCASATVSDAITEIANSSDYLFFYDSTNNKLYFKSPSNNFSDYPIICSSNSVLFANVSRKNTIIVNGVDCKYMRFDISESVNSIIANCKCSCAYASALGQFVFNNALNPRFINCEACLSHGAENGDGFNAHAAYDGETDAHESGTILDNCWAHDNMDDGYSEHHRAECTFIGGLYEYNGKGGITPSYGSQVSCYNVVSRHNYNGFIVVADGTSDHRSGGALLCVNCVAENNNTPGQDSAGFKVLNANNTVTLINCYSINNAYGYYCSTDNNMRLINCYASGNTTDKYAAGTITISNATLVT